MRTSYYKTRTWRSITRNPKAVVLGAGLRKNGGPAQARRNLEIDLRSALASESLELHYQPLFNLKTRRISTCEALLRWPHHQRGMIAPCEFIPLAEETGLIVEIGNRVLYKACLECRRWPGDTAVAVNFSPIQFERSDVPAIVRETLDATKLPANRLEIEITESTLLRDTSRTMRGFTSA